MPKPKMDATERLDLIAAVQAAEMRRLASVADSVARGESYEDYDDEFGVDAAKINLADHVLKEWPIAEIQERKREIEQLRSKLARIRATMDCQTGHCEHHWRAVCKILDEEA